MELRDHRIEIELSVAREVHHVDRKGEFARDSTKVFADFTCAVRLDDGRRVAFGIDAEIARARLGEPETADSRERLDALIREAVPAYLARCSSIDLFKTHDLHLATYLGDEPSPAVAPLRQNAPIPCSLTAAAFQHLDQQYAAYLAAQESFGRAVDRLAELVDFAPSGLKYYESEALTLLGFLDRALRAANVGDLYNWYNEKQSGIRHYLLDMLKRKQANHPNYKCAQQYIRSNLYCYHAPEVWREQPPVLPSDIG